jgi:RimJ/RimL family protein N-acetyltransferase
LGGQQLSKGVNPIVSGEHVYLRDRHPTDVDRFVYWQTHGEWRHLDAPWEGFGDELTAEQEKKIRYQFLEKCEGQPFTPRRSAFIVAKDGHRPLGWVSSYQKENIPSVGYVGINICEDDALNRGLGSEALKLWIDYVFTHRDIHKLGLETWSFNPRMMHVALKVGFKYEGTEREVRHWQGDWLDLVHYGMVRKEWQNLKRK